MNVPSVTDTVDTGLVIPALWTRTEDRRRFILRQIRLLGITRLTQGIPQVRIALIDGPVSISHPVLSAATIEQYPQIPGTELADQSHATFIASLLVGRGGGVLGIAPGCTIVSLPIQDGEFQKLQLRAEEAAERVARAIYQAVELRADVIQLSLDFVPAADAAFRRVVEAIRHAAARGTCIVVAAGNRPRLGSSGVLAVPGVLAVAMADDAGRIYPGSPIGPAIGRGLRCPGSDLPGAVPPDLVIGGSGSSFAAALVSGAIALLRSLRQDMCPLEIAANYPRPRVPSVLPPLMDGAAWLEALPRD